MASVISYNRARNILISLDRQSIEKNLHLIPDLLKVRCRLEKASDYDTIFKVSETNPLYMSYACARYIESDMHLFDMKYLIPGTVSIEYSYFNYYTLIFQYKTLDLDRFFPQYLGKYEIFLSLHERVDLYDIYLEDWSLMLSVLKRFHATDMFIGSFVRESICRRSKKNFIMPEYIEVPKIEFNARKISTVINCQTCSYQVCDSCWARARTLTCFAMNSLKFNNYEYMVDYIVVFNGEDGFILYTTCGFERGKEALSKILLDRSSEICDSRVRLDIMDIGACDYTTYTRLPYSINSNTGYICNLFSRFEEVIEFEKANAVSYLTLI